MSQLPMSSSVLVATLTALVFSTSSILAANSNMSRIPAPALDETPKPESASEVAILAGGCFWGVQGVFQHVKGVTSAVSGYAGGSAPSAQYETVSRNQFGSPLTRERSAMLKFSKFISQSLTMVRNSTVRDPTSARNIARPSFPLTRSKQRSPRPILISSIRLTPSTVPSLPRSSLVMRFTRRKDIIRIFSPAIQPIPTSPSTTCRRLLA
jgi:hypothetical protein